MQRANRMQRAAANWRQHYGNKHKPVMTGGGGQYHAERK